MIRTEMECDETGKYAARLYDNDTLIAEADAPLRFSAAVQWLARASADYVIAQERLARHGEGA